MLSDSTLFSTLFQISTLHSFYKVLPGLMLRHPTPSSKWQDLRPPPSTRNNYKPMSASRRGCSQNEMTWSERDAVTTRLEVEWSSRLPKGMTHSLDSQNSISQLNLFVGDFQRIMQDASDVERKLSDNERFKKRRRQLVHRVNMFRQNSNQ